MSLWRPSLRLSEASRNGESSTRKGGLDLDASIYRHCSAGNLCDMGVVKIDMAARFACTLLRTAKTNLTQGESQIQAHTK